MWIGWLECDLLLGDVHSLKLKRSLIRPLIADLRRKFAVSVAETGHQDLYRRSAVSVSAVSSDTTHIIDVLDHIEEYVAARPEMELLSTRRGMINSED